MALQIGIDLGTSGCRAVAINAERAVVAEARTTLPPSQQPATGHFEQSPEAWWSATLEVLDSLMATLSGQPIGSICVDGTSSTLLLCDANGTALTSGLMYNDQRAVAAAQQLRQIAPPQSAAHGASSSAAKLLHLIQTTPRHKGPVWALHQADWISNRLCNRWGESDENNCLKMGYDPVRRQWPHWLQQLNIPSHYQLPRVGVPGTPYGTLKPELMRRWNLSPLHPIELYRGTTDSIASTLAAGITQCGDAVTTLGTTLVLKILAERPIDDPAQGIYSHRLGERWLVSGASNAGGGVLRELFSLQEIDRLSGEIDPSIPSGLDYYPLTSVGERFPVADPNLPPRLTPRPQEDAQFLQGILEGLSRIEQQGYERMVALGAPPPQRILTVGGGAQNRVWMQLRQQRIQAPISIATQMEAAYGAALLPSMHL